MTVYVFTNGGPDMTVLIVEAESETLARGKAQKKATIVPSLLGTVEEITDEDGFVKL